MPAATRWFPLPAPAAQWMTAAHPILWATSTTGESAAAIATSRFLPNPNIVDVATHPVAPAGIQDGVPPIKIASAPDQSHLAPESSIQNTAIVHSSSSQ